MYIVVKIYTLFGSIFYSKESLFYGLGIFLSSTRFLFCSVVVLVLLFLFSIFVVINDFVDNNMGFFFRSSFVVLF